ncbi:hypothetical protein FQA47_005840 [Oryzias melastigma]|uniref:CARD domain-containing protein n=1 Tax=Oryzias melastigma TaxID=30732 RepID=A0A834L238_ORYME|nr:hypothetical protein FQA47_005840 [Oryzias melastigma]
MRLPSLGNCVDTAVEEVLVEFFNLKMFGSGTKKWFVKKQKRQQQRSGRRPCTRKKKRWTSKILKEHRQKILCELDVNTVLPYLVYERVFSLVEYKEILGQESSRRRTEVFLDHLSSKGPAAFFSFCSVLEEVCPHLLTCFLLDGEDGVPRPGRKGGLPVPPNTPAEESLCSPPMYSDPMFDSRRWMTHRVMFASEAWYVYCRCCDDASHQASSCIHVKRTFSVNSSLFGAKAINHSGTVAVVLGTLIQGSDINQFSRLLLSNHPQTVKGVPDMGRSGTAPLAQLLGECFHCQSFSAGNGVVMLSAEDAAEADAKE